MVSEMAKKLDKQFQTLDSVSMKNQIKYIATPYMGKWYWLDETYSVMSWDGQQTTLEARFVGKRDMIMLHRLILSGKREIVTV